MLKKITVKKIPGVSIGKIIKHHDVINYRTFNQILDHTQRHACKVIRDAEGAVDEIHNRAWIEGYVAGMTFSIQDLAKFVNDNESHRNNIINSALEIVTTKLQTFFNHEETICHLLGILVERLTTEPHNLTRVVVTIPDRLHSHSHAIKHMFVDAGLTIEIKKSSHQTILVEYGKEIWTYELNKVADNLARKAIQKALSDSQLQKQCEMSSISALKNIRDTLNHYLSNSA
ncbi:hypothetical protein JGC56_09730 [Salmonella enterica subsp. enterica serovar Saintpaul]|nr:hypothetical protein [Salmonella enterica subsp. enterica serovar Saintpaul]